MKAEKLAIWTWLSCQVTKNALMGKAIQKTDLFLRVFLKSLTAELRAELF
jgi:hypothetical protein